MITPEQMMELKKQEPFRPFRVVMRNGETFDVLDHLEFLPTRPIIHLPVRRRSGGEAVRATIRKYEDIDRVEMIDQNERGVA